MTWLFPFQFPGPTAFYLTLLVLTFALHQAFMHYVLAGSLYVAWMTLFSGPSGPTKGVQTQPSLLWILRDWMPFLLSAAITAGVAPLLFMQIVYQRQFYTANLLLFWRWMVVVPVLIVAFYLLYLIKSDVMLKWSRFPRAIVAVGTASCFVFVGFCWTANHLLGMSESKWAEIYVTGRLPLVASTVALRILFWISGSFLTMTAATGWQLRYHQQRQAVTASESRDRSQLPLLALGSLLVATITASVCYLQSDPASRQRMLASDVLPYLVLAGAGVVLQGVGWGLQLRDSILHVSRLAIVSCGAFCSVLGVSFLREAIRAGAVDLRGQLPRHLAASQIEGFPIFLAFTLIVSAAMVWCVQIVRQGWQAD